MQLNSNILQAQKLGADKQLKFGCLISRYVGVYDKFVYIADYGSYTEYGIIGGKYNKFYKIKTDPIEFGNSVIVIGSPINYSRLCYLYHTSKIYNESYFLSLVALFCRNPELYNQTILERPDDIVNIVRDFILSLQPNENKDGLS